MPRRLLKDGGKCNGITVVIMKLNAYFAIVSKNTEGRLSEETSAGVFYFNVFLKPIKTFFTTA